MPLMQPSATGDLVAVCCYAVQKWLNGLGSCLGWRLGDPQHIGKGVRCGLCQITLAPFCSRKLVKFSIHCEWYRGVYVNPVAVTLATDGMVRNCLVRGFIKQGFAAFEKFAIQTLDAELLGKIRIVKTYGHMLTSHIPKIRSKCVKDSFMAGIHDVLL